MSNKLTQLSLFYICHLILSLTILFLLSPLILLVGLLFFLFWKKPIFFRQRRLGKHLQVFQLFKIRTIDQNNVSKGISISKINKFFRDTAIDEFPSLVNVLLGQMTFIGPRPLLVEDAYILNLVCPERFEVLPGLTGLVQVLGRNWLSWRRRLALDLIYCKKGSVCLDFLICLLTIYIFSRAERLEVFGIHVGKPLKWELSE